VVLLWWNGKGVDKRAGQQLLLLLRDGEKGRPEKEDKIKKKR
jgi:hypothetical protein